MDAKILSLDTFSRANAHKQYCNLLRVVNCDQRLETWLYEYSGGNPGARACEGSPISEEFVALPVFCVNDCVPKTTLAVEVDNRRRLADEWRALADGRAFF